MGKSPSLRPRCVADPQVSLVSRRAPPRQADCASRALRQNSLSSAELTAQSANPASSGNDHSELLKAQADQATSAQTTPKTPKMIRNRVISPHPSNLEPAASDRGERCRS